MLSFFRVLSDWLLTSADDYIIVPIIFYRVPSIVFDVHTVGVGCKDQVCKYLFVVMSAVTGRTHVNWRYRTLRLGVIRQG